MNYELTENIKKAISEFENILEKLAIRKNKIMLMEKKVDDAIKVITELQSNDKKVA